MTSITAYHGTTARNAHAIIESGVFRKGTWFAFDVADALHMGGPAIFAKQFDLAEFNNFDAHNRTADDWQFHLASDLPLGDEFSVKGVGSFDRG